MISFIFPIHRSTSFICSEDDIKVKKCKEPVKRECQEPAKRAPKKNIPITNGAVPTWKFSQNNSLQEKQNKATKRQTIAEQNPMIQASLKGNFE